MQSRKILLTSVLMAGFLQLATAATNQSELEKNLVHLVNTKTTQEVTIDSTYNLNGDKNLFIAILKDKASKNLIPVVTNQSGQLLFVLTDLFFTQNDKDTQLVQEILGKVNEANNKNINKEAINKLLESIPDDYVVKIASTNPKVKKITYIISDPMCPHCQDELRHIDDRLKDSNVYMIEVAFLGPQSKDKSAELLERIKSLKTTKQKVSLVKEIYSTAHTAKNPNSRNIQKVENITKIIADSGLIKGVPFVYEYQK